jgi:hypothetical protein
MLASGGSVLIGSTSNSGEKLQVNGTAKITGATSIGGNLLVGNATGLDRLVIEDAKSSTSQYTSTGFLGISNSNQTANNWATIWFADGATQGWSAAIQTKFTDHTNDYGQLHFSTRGSGGLSTKLLIAENGESTFSSSLTVTGNLTVDTNTLFVDATNNRVGIGTATPGFDLDVVGPARFSSQLNTSGGTRNIAMQSFSADWNYMRSSGAPLVFGTLDSNTLYLRTNNTDRLTIASTGEATFSSTLTTGGNILIGATASTVGAINFIKTGTSPVASRLTFGSDGTGYQFAIAKNVTGTVTDLVTISDTGAANFNSSIQASTAIAIGTTPDSNNPFKILKNLNTTVGIKFENTNTSSLAFSAVQLGTDITGGTKFTNLVYASSGISASGVYNPDGTSLINNGSGGLNFLGNPIRMYTGGSNGVLRWDLVNDGYITHYSATAPTTSATDGYRQYSADVTAGNAAPHFRTENGAVIKLYQETTSVGNSIISLGGGSAVLDDTTFDGYTLRQIVKALRNQGILQ